MADLIVGLDIGTTKVCAVVGGMAENGLVDVVGIGTRPSHGMRKGVVVNIEQTVQSIRGAIEDAELMAGCEINSVYVGIAGGHIAGINSHGVIAVKGGEVGQRDVERALDAARAVAIPADREVIHILPQEYIVDNQRGIADPLGMAGVRLEVKVHIVTGAVTSAQNIVRSCHRSELEVSDIALESLASAKAVLTEEERELGVALVDIGGGTTDIAVLSMNGVAVSSSLKVAGNYFDEMIARYVRRQHGVVIGQVTAENVKIQIGQVYPRDEERSMNVKGRDFKTGMPKVITLTSTEIFEVLRRPARMITDEVLAVLEQTSPELVSDISENGITLTGGCSQIWGMDLLIAERTGIGCVLADDPDACTAYGAGKSLAWINHMQEGPINIARKRAMRG